MTPSDEVLAFIEGMTPEERVGQLFLISFEGATIADDSEIAALLAEYSPGGVVLRADQGNFGTDTINDLYQLVADLQKRTWDASRQKSVDATSGESLPSAYIPLWVGISQGGESPQTDMIFSGLSPLPNPMAIGATWQPTIAADVGQVLGSELSALGINLYLGPSLDILEDPDPANSGDMGTRSFGGNPYWVGEMGQAFISGLHTGSDGKILVVARDFPGRGSADRASNEEIATVRKTFEELKEFELAPFSAVTLGAISALDTVDGLLTAHIRYEGLQGNIFPTTRPISLDENSLAQIFTLSPFAEWRAMGGLTISDDLGSRAIRDFYAPGNEVFYAHLIARDAFLAGNDLLYMGNIVSSDAPNTYATIAKTLDFFAQKYHEDSAFAARVDEALARILTQKQRLYPTFTLYSTLPSQTELEEIGQNQQAASKVAQNAATLISPGINDLDAIFPAPPGVQERLIFITDTQTASECPLCGTQTSLDASSLPEAVLRLYGLGGAEEVLAENLSAYTFDDLITFVANEEHLSFQNSLQQADWVIISLANDQKLAALRQFLVENQPVLREKKIILFSFTSPYLLDATDISKVTAYYGLYSHAPPFLDVAARLLFKELTPVGAAPVSIAGIGYDLDTVTQPDPDQLLTLHLALPLEPQSVSEGDTATVAPTPIPMFQVGDTLGVRTGTVLDVNGHIVPDGTLVVFSLVLGGENGIRQRIEAETVSGVAHADFQLGQTGLLDIRVASGKATVSETLRLDISDEGVAAAVTIIPPALASEATPTPEIFPTPTLSPSPYVDEGKLRFGAWFIALLLWALGAVLAYFAGERVESTRWGLRWALSTLLGGIVAYNYLALDLPASAWVTGDGLSGVIIFILFAEIVGWVFGWMWYRRSIER
ncbi:MAG: hypothetical protein HN855_03255 [Anaerolineae bacterium]|nr:hypothetical protein [Anaerolineae bacterium]MBT7072488.1 hypothetical protein [Anaerolineae bacterium]MBT7324153.1 hypothetical protein [Anaerolineae bacterium]